MILDNNWREEVAERIAEEMTMHLLDVANPHSDNDLCGCLTCLSKIAIDIVMESLSEQSDVEMLRDMHDKNIKNNNVN